MRHFYKLMAGVINTPLMVEIMQKQDEILDKDGLCTSLPKDARKVALAVLQVTNGTALVGAELKRVNHDSKLPIGPSSDARYLAVLSGQVMCLLGDECPALNAGEVWWMDPKAEAIVVNKSGDDAILLYVTVRMDLE